MNSGWCWPGSESATAHRARGRYDGTAYAVKMADFPSQPHPLFDKSHA
jgi:hypothetical protein